MTKSHIEATFALQVRAAKLPAPVTEHRFCERRWRFDAAWPEHMLAVELEGGVWTGGRHTRGSGFVADMEKYNRAAILGWKVLRFDAGAVKRGEAIRVVESVLNATGSDLERSSSIQETA